MNRTTDRHNYHQTGAVLPGNPERRIGVSAPSCCLSDQALSRQAIGHRRDFSDEYAYFARGPDLGLAAPSTMALPFYTLVDGYAVRNSNGTWRWKYRGRYLGGAESEWVIEEEC